MPGLKAGVVREDAARRREPGDQLIGLRIHTEQLSASVVTGAAVLWILQSGFWTSLLILGLPLWRHVDLLPIVDSATEEASARDDPTPDSTEEQAFAPMLDPLDPQH